MNMEKLNSSGNTLFRVINVLPDFDPFDYEELKQQIAAELWAALKRKETMAN